MLFEFVIKDKVGSNYEVVRRSSLVSEDRYEFIWNKCKDFVERHDKSGSMIILINRFTDDGEFDSVIQ